MALVTLVDDLCQKLEFLAQKFLALEFLAQKWGMILLLLLDF